MTNEESKKLNVFRDIAMDLISGMGKIANKNLPKTHIRKNRCYPFIPYNLNSAYNFLTIAYDTFDSENNYIKPTFLDCGCGIGNIALLAANIGYKNVAGIEFSKKIANIAEATTESPRRRVWKVIRDNVLTFKHYHEYDVIYYYCPIIDRELEKKFERRVQKHMSIGSLVIALGTSSNELRECDCFEEVTKNRYLPIFRKIKEV